MVGLLTWIALIGIPLGIIILAIILSILIKDKAMED